VKYEIGVCIKTGHIVWVNGPFPASHNDDSIFKDTLASNLFADDEEGVEVDAGCKGHDKFKTPRVATSRADQMEKSIVCG
jgi:hypothetical protein